VYLLEEWNQIRLFFTAKTKQERERERENESGPPWISQQNRSIKRFLREDCNRCRDQINYRIHLIKIRGHYLLSYLRFVAREHCFLK
jgi:hypothetical protein